MKLETFVCGPEDGHIVIDGKFYLIDYLINREVQVGDYVKDKWSYCYVFNVLETNDQGYTLFQGYELKKEEYRERMIKKIIE